jgi:alcohol dehydrogenase
MKAIRLEAAGHPLRLEEVPDPTLRSGGVLVRVRSAPVLSFMKDVISGRLGYAMPTPFTPGANAVGVVEAVAADVFGLQPGDRVFCDPWLASHTQSGPPDAILIGLTGLTPQAERLQRLWRDGTFAEKALWPAEALTPLNKLSSLEDQRLAYLSFLAIPYGGFLRGELRPGQTVIVNGATGTLGAAGVLVAHAMGAAAVIAVGRDRPRLEKMQALDPQRVIPVALAGQLDADRAALRKVTEAADLLLDLLGGATTPDPTLACLEALRPRGTAILMGGVQAQLPLAYAQIMLKEVTIRGAFMYPRHAPGDLLNMIAAGTLDVTPLEVSSYPLERIDEALKQAARSRGLAYCVVVP